MMLGPRIDQHGPNLRTKSSPVLQEKKSPLIVPNPPLQTAANIATRMSTQTTRMTPRKLPPVIHQTLRLYRHAVIRTKKGMRMISVNTSISPAPPQLQPANPSTIIPARASTQLQTLSFLDQRQKITTSWNHATRGQSPCLADPADAPRIPGLLLAVQPTFDTTFHEWNRNHICHRRRLCLHDHVRIQKLSGCKVCGAGVEVPWTARIRSRTNSPALGRVKGIDRFKVLNYPKALIPSIFFTAKFKSYTPNLLRPSCMHFARARLYSLKPGFIQRDLSLRVDLYVLLMTDARAL